MWWVFDFLSSACGCASSRHARASTLMEEQNITDQHHEVHYETKEFSEHGAGAMCNYFDKFDKLEGLQRAVSCSASRRLVMRKACQFEMASDEDIGHCVKDDQRHGVEVCRRSVVEKAVVQVCPGGCRSLRRAKSRCRAQGPRCRRKPKVEPVVSRAVSFLSRLSAVRRGRGLHALRNHARYHWALRVVLSDPVRVLQPFAATSQRPFWSARFRGAWSLFGFFLF